MTWQNAEHFLAILGVLSILLHALEAGCNAAGWTKYEGIFQKLGAFIEGFMGSVKPPKAGGMAAVLLFVALMGGNAHAGVTEFLQKIPGLKQGVAYSVLDNKVNYIATTNVYEWMLFNVEVGYAGVAKDTGDKLVAVVSYDLFDLSGIDLPIVDLIKFRPGIYGGTGRLFGSNEWDWGISASVIDLKF